MKIIILAAGKGERLMPLTRNTPKPLLDMGNGYTLLEEQVLSIQEAGVIDEIVLVIGYLADQIEAKMKLHLHNGIRIRTIFNPFYEVSNNLMSLWLAKYELTDDFLITNGDNLFKPEVFKGLVEDNRDGIFLAVSCKRGYDDDDMKVVLRNEQVARVSKNIFDDDIAAESPGLSLVRGDRARKAFTEQLEKAVREKHYIDKFWLEVFNLLHQNGIAVMPWFFDGQNKWHEVDVHMDLNRVKELIKVRWAGKNDPQMAQHEVMKPPLALRNI